jgi:hypothetical protein
MAERVTVSVPDDLRRRMLKVKEDVNWSQVASEAFERKLGELANAKKEKGMDDVIARLRAADIEDASESQKLGREAGIHWAKTEARPAELRRLDKSEDPLYGASDDEYGVAVAYVIFGSGLDDGDAREWASEFGEDTLCDSDFWGAFVKGALEVWREVKAKV